MFYRFSIPEQLHSDQGRQFESEVMQEICHLLQVQKTRTTPGHLQSDGLVERFNRTLLNMLSTVVGDLHSTWDQHLRAICMAYNTSVQPSTGYSPFCLIFGRQPRLPIDLGYQTQTEQPLSTKTYVACQLSILEDTFRLVRTNMGVKQNRQKHLYDRKIHGDPYSVGDHVFLFSPVVPRGQSRKPHHPWIGPYQVIKKISEVTYRIKRINGSRSRQRLVVHFD